MAKLKTPETGSGQQNLSLRYGRSISPARASQMLTAALGHGYSRQGVYKLIESGDLRAHRVRKGGYLWVEQDSVTALIQRVLNSPPD
jgi:hypothetical protein